MQSIFFNHNEMKLGSTATEELDKSQICENKQHLLKQPVAQKRNHNRNQKTHKDVKQERKTDKVPNLCMGHSKSSVKEKIYNQKCSH